MNIYDFKVNDINGKEVSLDQYKGKVLLVINSATHCGLTPQYKALQALYDEYKEKGFEILDFPSNQFMNQAPENNDGIKSFCELNYQTTFPQFSKINVNGKQADPVFKYLKAKAPNEYRNPKHQQGILSRIFFGTKIKWNFTKFLINREGVIVGRFSPNFKPEEIKQYIDVTI